MRMAFRKLDVYLSHYGQLVSSNKDGIREMCERISSLVEYFKLVVTDDSPLSPALDNTIKTLARYAVER